MSENYFSNMLQLNPNSIYVAVKSTGDVKPVTFQQLLNGEASTDADEDMTVPATRFIDVTEPHKRVPRPLNAFMLFANDQRGKYKKLYPYMENKDISIKLGNDWHQLSEAEQLVYFDKAKALEKEHRKKYPDYQYAPARTARSTRGRKRPHMSPNERAARNSFKQRIMSYSTDSIRQQAPKSDPPISDYNQLIWQRPPNYPCLPPPPPRRPRQLLYFTYPPSVSTFSSKELEKVEPQARAPVAETRSRSLLKKPIVTKQPASEDQSLKRPRGRPPMKGRPPKESSSKESLVAQSNLVSLLNEQDRKSGSCQSTEENIGSTDLAKDTKPNEKALGGSRLVSIIKKHHVTTNQQNLSDGDNDLSDITTLLHHANQKPNIIGFPLQGEQGKKMVHLIIPESEESEESSDDGSNHEKMYPGNNPAGKILGPLRGRDLPNSCPPGSVPRKIQMSPNKSVPFEYPQTYEILPRYCSPPRCRYSPTWGAYPKYTPYDSYAGNPTGVPHHYHPWNTDYPQQVPPPPTSYHGYPQPYPGSGAEDLDSLQPSLCREDLQPLGDSSPMSLLAEACGLVYHRDCLDQQLPHSQGIQSGANPVFMDDESVFPHERTAASADGSHGPDLTLGREYEEPGKDSITNGSNGGPLYDPLYHRPDAESESQVADFCCLGMNGQHNVERLPSIDSFFSSSALAKPSTDAADALTHEQDEDKFHPQMVAVEPADEDSKSSAPSILEEAAKAADLVSLIKKSPVDLSGNQASVSCSSALSTEPKVPDSAVADSSNGEADADIKLNDNFRRNMATLQQLVTEALQNAGCYSEHSEDSDKCGENSVGPGKDGKVDSPPTAETEKPSNVNSKIVESRERVTTDLSNNFSSNSKGGLFHVCQKLESETDGKQHGNEKEGTSISNGTESKYKGKRACELSFEQLVSRTPEDIHDMLTSGKYEVFVFEGCRKTPSSNSTSTQHNTKQPGSDAERPVKQCESNTEHQADVVASEHDKDNVLEGTNT